MVDVYSEYILTSHIMLFSYTIDSYFAWQHPILLLKWQAGFIATYILCVRCTATERFNN